VDLLSCLVVVDDWLMIVIMICIVLLLMSPMSYRRRTDLGNQVDDLLGGRR